MLATAAPMIDPLDRVISAVEFFCREARLGPSQGTLTESLHRVCVEIGEAVASGSCADRLRTILQPAYDLHASSDFIRRLQTWPRGYPGDFETIEWIAHGTPRLDPDHPAYWLEWYALNSILGQQHRNKLAWQRGLIEQASLRGGRILNIGCGGCADLAEAPDFLSRCDLVLVDMDADALALAGTRLHAARSVRTIQRNVFRGLREALLHGPYDLVLCGGLFDYLPDALIRKLLLQLSAVVAADGQLAFTNIGDVNPLKPWMEHLADWTLIHRSAAGMEALLAPLDRSRFAARLEKDPTGLTWLCLVSAGIPDEPA